MGLAKFDELSRGLLLKMIGARFPDQNKKSRKFPNLPKTRNQLSGGTLECLDIPNRPLATEMRPLEVGDFSKNPDLPPRFFAEIHGLGQKVSQIQ